MYMNFSCKNCILLILIFKNESENIVFIYYSEFFKQTQNVVHPKFDLRNDVNSMSSILKKMKENKKTC